MGASCVRSAAAIASVEVHDRDPVLRQQLLRELKILTGEFAQPHEYIRSPFLAARDLRNIDNFLAKFRTPLETLTHFTAPFARVVAGNCEIDIECEHEGCLTNAVAGLCEYRTSFEQIIAASPRSESLTAAETSSERLYEVKIKD